MPKSSGGKGSRITEKDDGGFDVQGDMTFDTVRELLQQSKALFPPGSNLRLHLAEVQHADSAGLALLLEWIAQARKAGGSVAVEGMPESLKTIARLCRMEDELDSFVGSKQ